MKQEFVEALKEKKVLFLKSYMKKNPSWQNFIELIDYQYNNPPTITNGEFDDVFIYNHGKNTQMYSGSKNGHPLSLNLWYIYHKDSSADISNKFYDMPYIQDFIVDFAPDSFAVKSIINLAGNEFYGQVHKDPQDVVSWCCVGSVEYRVYEDVPGSEYSCNIDNTDDLKYDSYIMEPGDVILVPAGTIHQAICHEPRASILIDL